MIGDQKTIVKWNNIREVSVTYEIKYTTDYVQITLKKKQRYDKFLALV